MVHIGLEYSAQACRMRCTTPRPLSAVARKPGRGADPVSSPIAACSVCFDLHLVRPLPSGVSIILSSKHLADGEAPDRVRV